MITTNDVKSLFSLSLEDEEITPHLKRAARDFKDIEFKDLDDEIEIVGSKTLYYLAPLIWSKTSQKAREFDETLETFKDMEKFQEYWQKRYESLLSEYQTAGIDTDDDGISDIQSMGDTKWCVI